MKKENIKEIKGCPLQIYPRNIWVACGEEFRKDIGKCFTSIDYSELEEVGYSGGETMMVREKECNNEIGILIYLKNENVPECYIVHECVHAAMDICGNLDIDYGFLNQEALAYLTDYIYRIVTNMVHGGCDNTIPRFTKTILL